MANVTAPAVRTVGTAGLACILLVLGHYVVWLGVQANPNATFPAQSLLMAGAVALAVSVYMMVLARRARLATSPLDVVGTTRGLPQICVGMGLLGEAAVILFALVGGSNNVHLGAGAVMLGVASAPFVLRSVFPVPTSEDHPWQRTLRESQEAAVAMRVNQTEAPRAIETSNRPPFLREVLSPGISYDDVIGLDGAKRDVTEAIRLMENPQLAVVHGIEPVRGLLLHGPPGTGKTHFARATAGQFGKRFLEVRSSDLVSQYVGETEKNIAAAFAYARRVGPAILFVDEIDGLARDRSLARNDWEVSRVNALLTEMDGISKDPKAPIVIGATNRIDDLDPAILRPGRFDRKVLVGLPDGKDRARMLRQMLKGSRLAAGFDPTWLVAQTHGMSPADLKALVQDVKRTIFREGNATPRTIEMADFKAALATVSTTTRPQEIHNVPNPVQPR